VGPAQQWGVIIITIIPVGMAFIPAETTFPDTEAG